MLDGKKENKLHGTKNYLTLLPKKNPLPPEELTLTPKLPTTKKLSKWTLPKPLKLEKKLRNTLISTPKKSPDVKMNKLLLTKPPEVEMKKEISSENSEITSKKELVLLRNSSWWNKLNPNSEKYEKLIEFLWVILTFRNLKLINHPAWLRIFSYLW